jgi:tetratricopeptide (TPR) repeat protein
MADPLRIQELRHRVQKDPASLAFAQLGEEYRRAGQHEQAVQVCYAGLALHPGYLSARVTLGRALLQLGRLDDAQLELHTVLVTAPDNLAAVRSLAEVFQRRGESATALSYYQQALGLAGHDVDLQRTIAALERDLAQGISMPPEAPRSAPPVPRPSLLRPGPIEEPLTGPLPGRAGSIALPDASPLPLPLRERARPTGVDPLDDLERQHASRTIAALEQWLNALNGPGAERHS